MKGSRRPGDRSPGTRAQTAGTLTSILSWNLAGRIADETGSTDLPWRNVQTDGRSQHTRGNAPRRGVSEEQEEEEVNQEGRFGETGNREGR